MLQPLSSKLYRASGRISINYENRPGLGLLMIVGIPLQPLQFNAVSIDIGSLVLKL
jgi:hypothetical protein